MDQSIDISDCFFVKPFNKKADVISTFIKQIRNVKDLLNDFAYFFCNNSDNNDDNNSGVNDERYDMKLLQIAEDITDKTDGILTHLLMCENIDEKVEFVQKTYTSEILSPISVFTQMMEELNIIWIALHKDYDEKNIQIKNTIKTINDIVDQLISEKSINLSSNNIENFYASIKILNEGNLAAIETPLGELLDSISGCFPHEAIPREIKNIIEKYLSVCNLNATISLLKNSYSNTFKVNIVKAKTIHEEEVNNYIEKVKKQQKSKEDSENIPSLAKPFAMPSLAILPNRKNSLTTTSIPLGGKNSDFPFSFSKPPSIMNPEVLQLQEEKKTLSAKVKSLEIELQNAKDELESERMSSNELNDKVSKNDELFDKIHELEEILIEKDKAINKLTKELNNLNSSDNKYNDNKNNINDNNMNNNNNNMNNNNNNMNNNNNNNNFNNINGNENIGNNANEFNTNINRIDLEEFERIKEENKWLHIKIEEMKKKEISNETEQRLSQSLAKNAVYENRLRSTNEVINTLKNENFLMKSKSDNENVLQKRVIEQNATIEKLKKRMAKKSKAHEVNIDVQNEKIKKLESQILLLKSQKIESEDSNHEQNVSSSFSNNDENRNLFRNSRQKIINLLIQD